MGESVVLLVLLNSHVAIETLVMTKVSNTTKGMKVLILKVLIVKVLILHADIHDLVIYAYI